MALSQTCIEQHNQEEASSRRWTGRGFVLASGLCMAVLPWLGGRPTVYQPADAPDYIELLITAPNDSTTLVSAETSGFGSPPQFIEQPTPTAEPLEQSKGPETAEPLGAEGPEDPEGLEQPEAEPDKLEEQQEAENEAEELDAESEKEIEAESEKQELEAEREDPDIPEEESEQASEEKEKLAEEPAPTEPEQPAEPTNEVAGSQPAPTAPAANRPTADIGQFATAPAVAPGAAPMTALSPDSRTTTESSGGSVVVEEARKDTRTGGATGAENNGVPNPGEGSGTETAARQNSSRESDPGEANSQFGCHRCVKPEYAQAALDANFEGTTIIEFDFDEDGNVVGARVARSSGNAALDASALNAARASKFTQMGQGGTERIAYPFSIEGSAQNRAAERRGDRRTVERPNPAPVAPNPVPPAPNNPPPRNTSGGSDNTQPESPSPVGQNLAQPSASEEPPITPEPALTPVESEKTSSASAPESSAPELVSSEEVVTPQESTVPQEPVVPVAQPQPPSTQSAPVAAPQSSPEPTTAVPEVPPQPDPQPSAASQLAAPRLTPQPAATPPPPTPAAAPASAEPPNPAAQLEDS